MKAVADTGPLLAALFRREPAHHVASAAVGALGRRLLIPDMVAVEIDHLLGSRNERRSARLFLASLAAGELPVAFLTPGLLRRAVEIDDQYADLELGLVDASVMAIAERHDLPILTFDFAHFRATESARGPWRLVISEQQLAEALA